MTSQSPGTPGAKWIWFLFILHRPYTMTSRHFKRTTKVSEQVCFLGKLSAMAQTTMTWYKETIWTQTTGTECKDTGQYNSEENP